MTTTVPSVDVVGVGFLARHLAARLARPAGPGAGVRVLVAELDDVDSHHDTMVECVGLGQSLLFVGRWRAMVYIGPMWTASRAGCPRCLVSRVANSPFGPELDGDAVPESSGRDTETWSLRLAALGMVERYAQAALDGVLLDPGRVLVLDTEVGTAEPQVLLPDSTCAGCGRPAATTVPSFAPADTALPKLAPATLRTRQLDPATLGTDYLFSGLGLFKELRQDLQSPYGACSVELSTRWGRREPAIGRARSYADSRSIAVLEGLERYAGLHRGGRRAPVRAAYADVADRALYPPRLGTHPASSYAREDFRYRAFDPDTVVDWVWAYSFRESGRVLVPERFAFWGPRHDQEVSFCYDTSNGCALGNSAEEAVLHGLREVAERDSFLLTWYRRLALPEVALPTDGELGALLRKARLFTGFDFRCFQSTMEYHLPTFWLVACRAQPGDGPAVLAGSGAHPDPRQAVTGGLHELIGSILATRHSYPRRRPEALRMLDDPTLIRRMEDHSLVGALPEARDRYSFLLDAARPTVALDEIPGTVADHDPDIRGDLHRAVGDLLAVGLDVLVVDQTMPELARNGLHCTRVIVPGLVPMTFGHLNRRTEGLPRLTDGTGLPYPSQLADGEEVGDVPHPFP
ncbi:ribosomal protein S12 methylthiotransferase accessory factor [Micromonospora viridifaciens]|uniref:Ribosomal protein S12 methylthiotransferase accessory factor n=1 Tax=Micromonospora viridifaciens TaxID=1881 RepID=A0A1C4ZQY3_MICVI|nr:TOMM precursor leader peptide-binding protein [Micromonospora viridifaciens]SCF35204.1 ribosomal protein S12 methylthiotransferase accessory factor [Micromonospora viridifaciens]